MVHIVPHYTGRTTQEWLKDNSECPQMPQPPERWVEPNQTPLQRPENTPHSTWKKVKGPVDSPTARDQNATEVNHHHRDGNMKLHKQVKATGVTTHLLFFNNGLSIALHLLHNDLFFFWQQDLRDAIFPHRCTQIQRRFGVTSPSAGEGLSEESRKAKHTCGVLVQAGTRAVSLDHPQYLGIFLQSNCAYGQSDYRVPVTQLQIYQVIHKNKVWWKAEISLTAAWGCYIYTTGNP